MERFIGKKAPDFTMSSFDGTSFQFDKVSLEDYSGKWLVMVFYPLDFTPIWQTEITEFSDRIEEFKEIDTEILSVSTDSEHSHKAWCGVELGDINFQMAADMTKNVSRDFGILIEEEGISQRGLFIIDPEGIVRYSVIHDIDVGRNVDETLRVLKALQREAPTPVNWEEGEDVL